ncbi:MAG: pilin [Candidatus Komeilibacteria bacterium]|nr:pilin [Candidatus Komeilibacteria bacterium]
MMKKILTRTNIIAFAMLAIMVLPVMAIASTTPPDLGLNDAANIGLGDEDAKDIVTNIVRIILGFLGLVAVIIILAGGFMWMTAGGNEDKVSKGRKLIINGVIGLVIVLAAFSIATFVINSLENATGLN